MTDHDIARVRDANPIEAVVAEYLPLKHVPPRRFVGRCPFHAEKTPSFSIWTDIQAFKCFGCGITGDVITFVQHIEAVPFPEALQRLADRANIRLDPVARVDRREQAHQRQDAVAIAEEATAFWREIRISLCRRETELVRAEHAGCRYVLGHPEYGDHDLTVLAIHAAGIAIAGVQRSIDRIDRCPGPRLVAAYLQFRTPATVKRIRESRRELDQESAAFLAVIAASTVPAAPPTENT